MDLKRFLRAEGPIFLLALQFLTRLPVRADVYTPERLAESPRWYPGVGVVVGLLTGLVAAGALTVYPPVVAVILSTVAGLLLTGALHEDGFADACDGLGGGRTRERAMEIMRDSRIGSYGAVGLMAMLAGKVATLSALPPAALVAVLIAGHTLSRGSAVWVMATSRYARAEGAGAGVAEGVDGWGRTVAGATCAAALLPLLWVMPVISVGLGLCGLAAGHYAMRRRFEPRLGGYTGDCLGAVQQCSEIGFYLGLLALI